MAEAMTDEREPMTAADEVRVYLSTPPITPAWFGRELVTQLLAEYDAATTRAETAERELAEMRERIGREDVEWSVRWHEDGAVSEKRHTETEARERGGANPKTMAAVSRVVGEWKAAEQQPEDGDRG